MAKIASPQLMVFPVPGEEVFRSQGIHLNHMGFETAANPRTGNVMIIAAPASEALAKKAAVAYLQMPRPRALVFAGTERVKHLPQPDFRIKMEESDFRQLRKDLRKFFSQPFDPDAGPFGPDFIKKMQEENKQHDQGHEHHHMHGHGNHQHGQQQKQSEHEGPEKGKDEHTHHEHSGHKHHEHGHQMKEHKHNEDKNKHEKHQHGAKEEKGKKHSHHQEHEKHERHKEHQGHEHEGKHQHEGHGQMKHGEHQHGQHEGHGGHGGHGGGMGFMSMVMMTKDMPAAMDGLKMEHNQAWFGPFFPGLTGGLAFKMMLDGDTVMKVEADKDLFMQDESDVTGMNAAKLPFWLASQNPLTPETYRIMGIRFLMKMNENVKALPFGHILTLERERICSHLNWLATMGKLTGNQWICNTALAALYDFQKKKSKSNIIKLTEKILKFSYLKKKLSVGMIPENLLHHASGPVARASGIRKDKRSDDENYRRIGFQVTTINENNAWGRLQMRLMEIEQSLDLINRIEKDNLLKYEKDEHSEAEGSASIELETPRGKAGITGSVENGKVKQLQLQTVSGVNMILANEIVNHMELSEALITIMSLDINPCELIAHS